MISRLSEEQQKKLAIGLVAVLALVLLWRLAAPAISNWLTGSEARQRAERSRSLAGLEIADLRLDLLQAEPNTFSSERDIFRYPPPKRVAPPPPPPPPPRTQPPPRDRQPPPPRVLPAPRVPYELLGIFGPEDRRIAVLRDGKELVNAMEEETLQEKFIVHDIGLTSVEFHKVGFDDTETLSLEDGARGRRP